MNTVRLTEFGLAYFFNGIPIFVDYLISNLILVHEKKRSYLIHIKGISGFMSSSSAKVIAITRLEFEIACFDVTVQHVKK